MKTPPAVRDLEAAVPAGSAAAAAHAQQVPAPAANKVAQEEEDPRLCCAFVRETHGILFVQFVLTAAVAATACFVRPVHRFFAHGPRAAVWPTLVVTLASPLIVCAVTFPMLEEDREKHPTRNRVLLSLFTLGCTFSVAMSACTTVADMAFLQVAILLVLGSTVFAIWAAKRGYDFSDTFPALFTWLATAPLAYTIVLIPFPLKLVGLAICGFLATLLFWGFFVVDGVLKDVDGDDRNGSRGGSVDGDDTPPPAMKREKESGSFGVQTV